jgi:DNA-binding SARP family transcriptional activator
MEKFTGGCAPVVPPPRWSLQLFGGFRLSAISGASVTLPGKRERLLLAYLLLSPNCRQPRRKLAALLWGDTTDEAALHNLRTCVWGLRNALSDPERQLLQSEGDEIALEARLFEVDAWTFCRLALQPGREPLQAAASLYAGPFLEGLDIDCEEFEAWRRAEAIRYRDQAIDVLARLMTKLSGDDEAENAIRIGQRILALDPMHEVAVRQMMRLYADIGRRGAAVQLYQSLGRVLRTELNTEPEPETQSLFAELSNGKRHGALAAARENRPAVSTGTVPPTPASSHGVSHPTASVLLWSRFTVPRWIALTAATVAIVFFSLII